MSLNERLNKEKANIAQLKDLPEYEEEIKRKKQLANNLEKDLKEAIKERKEREKKVNWPIKMKRTSALKQVLQKRSKTQMLSKIV